MKIYFTASTAEFKKYKHLYFSIRDYLVDQGHLLTRDWLPTTNKKIDTGQLTSYDVKTIYKLCVKAIREADLVIIEDTVSNFSTGHQITLALEMQKPTLVLWNQKKHKHFNMMFIHGIESDYLEVKQYTQENMHEIITTFINKYENIDQKNRFHLVLNQLERNYLDWAQFTQHKSRTKIIRDALKSEIENNVEYQNYLGEKKSAIIKSY